MKKLKKARSITVWAGVSPHGAIEYNNICRLKGDLPLYEGDRAARVIISEAPPKPARIRNR